MKHCYLLFVVAILFTSCATPNYQVKLDEPGGFVVGSIAVKDVTPRFDNYQVKYQRAGELPSASRSSPLFTVNGSFALSFKRKFIDADQIKNGEAIHNVVTRLKPGKYYVSYFSASNNSNPTYMYAGGAIGGMIAAAMSSGGYDSKNEIFYPFTVENDKITYLGEFYFDGKRTRKIEITNKYDRDMTAIDYKYPRLKRHKVKTPKIRYLKHH